MNARHMGNRTAKKRERTRTAEEREKTAEKAIKIIGKDKALRGDIVGELYHLETALGAIKRIRQRHSKQALRALKQLSTAVRKANRRHGGVPEDFRISLGLDYLEYHLQVYERGLGNKPKPDAYEKRLAAEAALRLCRQFGVNPTTTKGGQFCKLAALLYDDQRADLQHHCREALRAARRTRTAKVPDSRLG